MKTTVVNPDKLPAAGPFTPEMARQIPIEVRKTNVAGQYGFRIRCIADQTGDVRLIQSAARYADDHALGVARDRDLNLYFYVKYPCP